MLRFLENARFKMTTFFRCSVECLVMPEKKREGIKDALRQLLLREPWGARSLVALLGSVVSGAVLALQYNVSTPFYSSAALDLLVPFGVYFRSLHFWSSQIFFLFFLIHLGAIMAGSGGQFPAGRWLQMTATVPVVVLLLFSGYVLRGDATGESAGAIAENITESLPIFGGVLDGLLFSISTDGLRRVYANHLIGLGLLWLVLSWDHVRRYRIQWRMHQVLLALLVASGVALPAPMEPHRLGVFHIAGPWFFLGLQELLRYIQPFWAGIVYPASFLSALALFAWPIFRRPALFFLGGWLFSYALLTFMALGRG